MPRPDKLAELNAQYTEITGESLYLYCSRPGDGSEHYIFQGMVVRKSRPGAIAYMESALADAKEAAEEQPST